MALHFSHSKAAALQHPLLSYLIDFWTPRFSFICVCTLVDNLHPWTDSTHLILHCPAKKVVSYGHKLKMPYSHNTMGLGWNNRRCISTIFQALPLNFLPCKSHWFMPQTSQIFFFSVLKIKARSNAISYLNRRIKIITFIILFILFQVTGEKNTQRTQTWCLEACKSLTDTENIPSGCPGITASFEPLPFIILHYPCPEHDGNLILLSPITLGENQELMHRPEILLPIRLVFPKTVLPVRNQKSMTVYLEKLWNPMPVNVLIWPRRRKSKAVQNVIGLSVTHIKHCSSPPASLPPPSEPHNLRGTT